MFSHLNHLSHHAAWRRQLEMLLESVGEGIYCVDLRGRCLYVNSTGARMLGYSADELHGRNMHYLIHHSHANGELMAVNDCRIYRAYQEGKGCRVDDEVLWHREGRSFPVEYASFPIVDQGSVVGAVVTFSDISARKQAEQALQVAHAALERRVAERTSELSMAHEALRRLSSHLQSVREEERAHIARDIHDDLGASLTALQLDLNWLRRQWSGGEQPALSSHVERMLGVAGTAMQAVHRILNDLRPGVLDHLGLWAALECLLQEVQQRSGLQCRFHCTPAVERCRLGRDAEIAVYRIVQEVLTNVQRHAKASSVVLEATDYGADLCLQVADNGCGMVVPPQPNTFGLLGMMERARALGGELRLESQPGAGTRVSLRLRQVLAATEAPP